MLLLAAVFSAEAAIGSSYNLGFEASGNGYLAPIRYPTLDFVSDSLILQFHPMEFLSGLTNDEVFLAGNVYVPTMTEEVAGNTKGVFQPGASLDIYSDNITIVSAAGVARLGVEQRGSMAYGMYIAPAAGFAMVDGDLDLLFGGNLQFSVWFE